MFILCQDARQGAKSEISVSILGLQEFFYLEYLSMYLPPPMHLTIKLIYLLVFVIVGQEESTLCASPYPI